ncbi:three-helix bundle dimerization domain-containing protein [Glaciihabitans sp. UYNi722]|uniref:three-helix bundle dimerization domain-containing protein n=1 Tax=Glaciihabitans sp. UYNi722 TaxID=3156344 RepID=UPI003398DC9A
MRSDAALSELTEGSYGRGKPVVGRQDHHQPHLGADPPPNRGDDVVADCRVKTPGEVRLRQALTRSADGAQNWGMSPLTTESAVAKLVDRLALRFPKTHREHIASTVAEEYAALSDSRISTYIPNLVEHGARSRLQDEVHRLSSAV